MDKQLRLLAGMIVVESKMSKQSKIQLLNFIKEEASDAQVKALLMDGKIVQLDEQAEEIVNDRFSLISERMGTKEMSAEMKRIKEKCAKKTKDRKVFDLCVKSEFKKMIAKHKK